MLFVSPPPPLPKIRSRSVFLFFFLSPARPFSFYVLFHSLLFVVTTSASIASLMKIRIQLCMSISHKCCFFFWSCTDYNVRTQTTSDAKKPHIGKTLHTKTKQPKQAKSLHETNQIDCIEMFYIRRFQWQQYSHACDMTCSVGISKNMPIASLKRMEWEPIT